MSCVILASVKSDDTTFGNLDFYASLRIGARRGDVTLNCTFPNPVSWTDSPRSGAAQYDACPAPAKPARVIRPKLRHRICVAYGH